MSAERSPGRAATSPDERDARLRGLTCAVPFEDVWQASLRLAGGELRRWTVTSADDQEGVIHAEARRLSGAEYDILIMVRLDQDAQTRVDAVAQARRAGRDFGSGRRLLRRFFRALIASLQRLPARRTAAR